MRKATPEEQALWPTPNFENPEQLRAPVIGATVTTFLLALLCKWKLISNIPGPGARRIAPDIVQGSGP